ncbi:flagellin [Lichenicoccus roseus]|uniref:Flagellin n=1 Tax=Lichenicoccus roseus TaxID=2683649 RepID=A0A5R9J4Z1_9PROT|nr:flagellin [Lichenicoccus roseus]TLU72695.1 flagellin B [Lichenicoccus roseus]
MTFSVNTNTASIAALASLRMTATQLTQTENQISTGKKISSASDDPAVYAISQGMNSQIAGLAGVSSGLQFTAQVVSTASTQATATSGLLSSLAQTITAGQTNGLSATTINNSINATLKQIDANATGATFQGVNLLSGSIGSGVTSTSVSAVQDLVGDKFSLAGSNATSSGLGLAGLNVAQAGLQIAVGTTATAFGDGAATPAELTLVSSAPGGTATTGTAQSPYVTSSYILNNAHTADAAITTAINTALGSQGSTATVTGGVLSMAGAFTTSTDANNNSVYTDTATGNSITVSTDASNNNTYSVSTAVDSNGNTTAKTNITSVETSSAETNNATNAAGTAPLQVDLLMTAVQNSGYGVTKDSTTGDLTVSGGNLNTIDPNNASSVGTGTVTAVTGSAVAVDAVNAAISKMNTISSSLGSSTNLLTGLQSTVSTLSDALTSGVGALTDADLSAESAKLTSLQTKQQLAIQSLSIANSQSSSIMSLFR